MIIHDYVADFLKRQGALTRDNYIQLNWPGRDFSQEPLSAEEAAELPEEMQIESEGVWIN